MDESLNKSYQNRVDYDKLMKDIAVNPESILDHKDLFCNPSVMMNFLPLIKKSNAEEYANTIDYDLLSEKEKEIGNEFFNKKDFVKAIAHYNKAIGHNPNNLLFYTNKATALLKLSRVEEAIMTCKSALELSDKIKVNPEIQSKVYVKLSLCYSQLNDIENAIDYMMKGYSLSGDPSVLKLVQSLKQK